MFALKHTTQFLLLLLLLLRRRGNTRCHCVFIITTQNSMTYAGKHSLFSHTLALRQTNCTFWKTHSPPRLWWRCVKNYRRRRQETSLSCWWMQFNLTDTYVFRQPWVGFFALRQDTSCPFKPPQTELSSQTNRTWWEFILQHQNNLITSFMSIAGLQISFSSASGLHRRIFLLPFLLWGWEIIQVICNHFHSTVPK